MDTVGEAQGAGVAYGGFHDIIIPLFESAEPGRPGQCSVEGLSSIDLVDV